MTFVVGDERITAQRAIVGARSEHFRSLFDQDFADSKTAEVRIPDTPPDAFRAYLRYLYTDEIAMSDEAWVDVARLAHCYMDKRLYSLCKAHCEEHLSNDNALSWLLQAVDANLDDLATFIKSFVTLHFGEIREEKPRGWDALKQYPNLMFEMLSDFSLVKAGSGAPPNYVHLPLPAPVTSQDPLAVPSAPPSLPP